MSPFLASMLSTPSTAHLPSSADVNDFESVSRQITFDPTGPNVMCFSVPIVNDTKQENPEEVFDGAIEVPTTPGVERGTPGTAMLVILDDDGEFLIGCKITSLLGEEGKVHCFLCISPV